ncbi:hypothetical protein B566_EDAN004084, partial [Ephemera danica]
MQSNNVNASIDKGLSQQLCFSPKQSTAAISCQALEHERVVKFALGRHLPASSTPSPENDPSSSPSPHRPFECPGSGATIPPGCLSARECVRALASACAWCGDAVGGGVRQAMGCTPSVAQRGAGPTSTEDARCTSSPTDEAVAEDDSRGFLRNHQHARQNKDEGDGALVANKSWKNRKIPTSASGDKDGLESKRPSTN